MEYHKTTSTKTEERMTEMQKKVDGLQDGCHDKSIIKALKQEGVSNVFSEESKRKLKEMGNIELYELGETVRTTQCPFCLKHFKEGTSKTLEGRSATFRVQG